MRRHWPAFFGICTLSPVQHGRKPEAMSASRRLDRIASTTWSGAVAARGRIVAALASILVAASAPNPAAAQGRLRCSAFLHERGGSWRAFEPGVIFGPRGAIPVKVGERFRRGRPSAQDYVAGVLDTLCRAD